MGGYMTILSQQQSWQARVLITKKHIGLHIVHYFQVHEDGTPRNSNIPHTKGDIFMGSSRIMQGGFKFMILRSVKNITRKYWDMIPKLDTVIYRFHLLGKYQPEILVFTDSKDQLIVDGGVDLTGVYMD